MLVKLVVDILWARASAAELIAYIMTSPVSVQEIRSALSFFLDLEDWEQTGWCEKVCTILLSDLGYE